jgi:serine/threonine-protein kinase
VKKAKIQSKSAIETILRPGQIVGGQYQIDRLVGQGAMTAVWAGTNQHTGKRVALKVILRSLSATWDAQNHFRSEALAACRVNHPNVASVFDVIEHEGMACIVMELLEGESLASRIARKGFLSLDEAAALLLPAMRGVAAANAQGVIHRGLKPQNIFVCIGPDGRIVTTKVLDFGISIIAERVLEPSPGPVPVLAMGTPAYLSPEYILGAAHIDGRADVYGFGVLLYEALTGQLPFPGEPGPAVFERVLHKPAPPVTLFRPDLPAGLARIIETAMAKDPALRFADLSLMVGALEDELMLPGLAAPSPTVCAVESAKPEPPAPHQGTQFLFGTPQEDEGKQGNSHAEPREFAPTTLDPSLLGLTPWCRTPARSPSAHAWRGLAGAGCAVALGILAVWIIMRGTTRAQTSAPALLANTTPPSKNHVLQPAPPVVETTAMVARAAIVAPSQPAPPLATRGHSRRASHPHPGASPIAPSRPRGLDPPPPLQTVHGSSRRVESAPPPSPAPTTGNSAKGAAPRAGRLSKDDF